MAKKPQKPVVKKEVKKTSESSRKIKNILRAEKLKNPESDNIISDIKSMITDGRTTKDIRNIIIEKYSLSKSNSTNFIKKARKQLDLYNYGDLPKTIKEYKEYSFKIDLENSIKNCPSLNKIHKTDNKKNNKKGN